MVLTFVELIKNACFRFLHGFFEVGAVVRSFGQGHYLNSPKKSRGLLDLGWKKRLECVSTLGAQVVQKRDNSRLLPSSSQF